MLTGISVTLTLADRRRLEAITKDRSAAQKQAWRATIVLLRSAGRDRRSSACSAALFRPTPTAGA
jgi:hypothetical protein